MLAAWLRATYFKADPSIAVATEKVARRNITEIVIASGKIEPVLQVKISPEVSGEIIQLNVKEGQDVKKGDLLFKIKPDNYLAASNSAQANYKSAGSQPGNRHANLEKADWSSNATGPVQGQSDFRIGFSDGQNGLRRGQVHPGRGAVEQISIARAQLDNAGRTWPRPRFIRR